MHFKINTDIKILTAQKMITTFARLYRSEVLHGRAAMMGIGDWPFKTYLNG
tara:strand:+ start:350 stop:502 length:153 start_codon:yes stop_codon:yes gene_type:complete